MSFLDSLFHGPAAIDLKSGEADSTAVTVPATSTQSDVSWPDEWDFIGWANGMYTRQYAVRVVVDFIARNIASLPFKVYRRDADGDAMEVRDGSLAQLMRRPSMLPGMTRYRFIARLLEDMLLEDKWLCVLGISKGRWTLRRIPADSYQLEGNALGEITGVRITASESMPGVHYDLPDPRIALDIGYIDGLRFGNPVTDVLRPLLAEARALERYRRNIAERGAQIPAYVYRPKEMEWPSQEAYDAFVQYMRNYTANGGMAGRLPVFKDGMEIRTVENLFKPIDMNDLEARDKINVAVCNAFQVSPENVGFREGTNSNIAAYKEKMWNVELMPYIVALEEALNLTLPDAVGEPECYVKANIDAKLRGTLETQYQALSTATGRPFMTTNYARQLLDMPRVPGGDELITPLNVSEGGQPSPQDGGVTQNAQTNTSPNGKTAAGMLLADFKRAYQYDAAFRRDWDELTGRNES